ncbi:MAG: MFS transporter [Pseudomonadota bacterium]
MASHSDKHNAATSRRRLSWLRADWRIILFGFILMFSSSAGQTYFIALFGGEIRDDLGLSHGQFGSIYSIATFTSAVLLLWSGTLLDSLKLNTFTIFVFVLLAFACLAMSFSVGVISLLLGILLLRHFGQGLMGMTSAATIMRFVPANKAKANALSHTGYSLAEAVVPSIIVAALAIWHWRELWIWTAGVLVLMMMPLCLQLLASQQKAKARASAQADISANGEPGDQAPRQWTRAEVIRDPLFYMIIPGLTSQSLLYTGYMFHQVHLVEEKGWSLSAWAGLYLLFSLTSLVMSFVIGWLVDRFGSLRVLPFINVAMICGLLLLAFSNSLMSAALFMVLMAISTAGQAATTAPFFSERYGNTHLGAIKSLGSLVMVGMTAISPIVLGLQIDAGINMSVLALEGVAYALIVSIVAWFGCRRALKLNVS